MNTVAPFKVDNLSSERFEDIDQALLAIEHALQTYTDLYDLRLVIEYQLENIRYDLSKIKEESTN